MNGRNVRYGQFAVIQAMPPVCMEANNVTK
jgi:hypothetical protein